MSDWNASDADWQDATILRQAAVKHDESKAQHDLIPVEAVEALAAVLTFGARKYSPRNWENGFRWGRVFSALMRHLWAWWARRGNDPETGYSHLWHALCCLAFLVAFEARGTGEDDRP
ncbi:hypothetical protein JI664_12780 [Rhodobacter sp. NTK016B]|uniref:dATP/dGTP diphosphohydrolase domain-containing protein n=1 Tax=Rhodobacter sp. NTK016B TaxID=2759676 RepID=UPI001A8C5E88|nr:dATP/dGTP diphosphohydrolase domain-containing protein [Rhodobacter sp. NTK016B]MBN8292842.1 hypothetical protein [Rhodobacter sp. NTK016B]